MFSTLFKVALVGAAVFGAYKALYFYSLFEFADHMRACLPASGTCRLVERGRPSEEVRAGMDEALACVRDRQPAVEAVVFKVPRTTAGGTISAADLGDLQAMCRDWGAQDRQGRKK